MAGQRKKKYQSGEATRYMTRKRALHYLQLSLKDFRRLCILKGIYPREPINRTRAQKGKKSIVKTLYLTKDIQFLSHEPIIWKLRDTKVFAKKMAKARSLKDFEKMKAILSRHPTLTLDHIVKERYPTFIDALRDLDDCLTLCFLFSTFPSLHHVPRNQSALCRRLTVEFMHAVIHARALRKVFISIKGYYYQAEIKGQTITWIVPHQFSFKPHDKSEVDFKTMSTFVEFYTVMLGFVNYYLYHSLNLIYPPKLKGYGINPKEKELVDEKLFHSERISALNIPLTKIKGDLEEKETSAEIEQFNLGYDESEMTEAQKQMMRIEKHKKLFEGLKFFINREVPREPLVFVIRCFGGLVSWDQDLFVGASFPESDESINYQIVDRPSLDKQYLSRYYVQPQWVFDSINAERLLPVEKYLLGAILPPHLSPFKTDGQELMYKPPEEKAISDPNHKLLAESESSESESEGENEKDESKDEEDKEDEEMIDSPNEENKKIKGMEVKPGEVHKRKAADRWNRTKEIFHLREKMIPRKHKTLYIKMRKDEERKKQQKADLTKKRRQIDKDMKEKKKLAKKEMKTKLMESFS